MSARPTPWRRACRATPRCSISAIRRDGLEGQGRRLADADRGQPDQMGKGGILGHEDGGIRPRDQGLDFVWPARRPLRFAGQVRPPAPVELVKLLEKLGQPLEIA